MRRFFLIAIVCISLTGECFSACYSADNATNADKESVKNANINEAEKLNSQSIDGTRPSSETVKKNNEDTANAVNQIPGAKINSQDLEPPQLPPIKGFHPIKKLLRPVENLEGMSIKLEQQIMKLEGPIAGLQPPMLNLQKKMTGVDNHIGEMQQQLSSVEAQVKGARADIASVRDQISDLKEPITALRGPIGNVAEPLKAVQTQLSLILLAILVTAVVIAIGTPIAAIQVYRNRHKIFPDLSEHELPKPKERVG